jgi:hypothetical protein
MLSVAIAGAPSYGVNVYLNSVAPNTIRIFEASQGWTLQTWVDYAISRNYQVVGSNYPPVYPTFSSRLDPNT